MTTGLRFLRINCPLSINSVLRNSFLNGSVCFERKRFIFSDNHLGINGYTNARLQMHQQFSNVESSFREKMNEIVKNDTTVVFTEDLKAMIHLVNKNPEDINLVVQMMHKFNSQNRELRFGNYIFGPVIMRAFYYLDEPDIALESFLDTKLTNFFDQNITYTILLTLLYKHNKFEDLRNVYNVIKSRNIDIRHFPKNALIVTAAACYKENTRESLQFALESWKELYESGIVPIRRVITFIAASAIKQNNPELALEILAGLKASRYIDNRCLKVLAYCKLNRLVDVIAMLRRSIEYHNVHKESYFSDVAETIEKSLDTADDSLKVELTKLVSAMKAEELIDPGTLDAHLLQPIERNNMRDRRNIFQNYNSSRIPDQGRRKYGLKDLF